MDARLDIPKEIEPSDINHFVIFCHCFTCSKETITTFRLSHLLAENGYGVLRFDFTGLGNSEGDFASTTFASTQDDLTSAIKFLETKHQTPSFLMGHSLGGTTALSVAQNHEKIKGVVAVASPSEPDHVLHHFGHALTLLEQNIAASFEVAGQFFDIEPAFVEDVRSIDMKTILSMLEKPVLIFNIENDALVDESNAKEILQWIDTNSNAQTNTTLIEITGSNHLLSNREATEKVTDDIIRWIENLL